MRERRPLAALALLASLAACMPRSSITTMTERDWNGVIAGLKSSSSLRQEYVQSCIATQKSSASTTDPETQGMIAGLIGLTRDEYYPAYCTFLITFIADGKLSFQDFVALRAGRANAELGYRIGKALRESR